MLLAILCLFSPFFTFAAHVIFTRTVYRVWRPRSPQKFLVRFLLVVSAVYATVATIFFTSGTAQILDSVLVFAYVFVVTLGFGYGYFHFFNMSETARRVHIVVLILESVYLKDASAARELATYDSKKMIQVRINRMLAMGGLYLKDGKYHAAGGGLLLSGLLFRKLRALFYGKSKPKLVKVN